jgi:hypothetical protein
LICRRHQAYGGHQGGHYYGAHAGYYTFQYSLVQMHAGFQVFAEHRYQDHPVLDTYPKQGDKANPCRDAEVDARNMQGQYAANQAKGTFSITSEASLTLPKVMNKDQEDNQ